MSYAIYDEDGKCVDYDYDTFIEQQVYNDREYYAKHRLCDIYTLSYQYIDMMLKNMKDKKQHSTETFMAEKQTHNSVDYDRSRAVANDVIRYIKDAGIKITMRDGLYKAKCGSQFMTYTSNPYSRTVIYDMINKLDATKDISEQDAEYVYEQVKDCIY